MLLAILVATLFVTAAPAMSGTSHTDDVAQTGTEPVPVTWKNFPRAETDGVFARSSQDLGKLTHMREPLSLDQQNAVRMNRDMLYSYAVLDLNSPATLILPDGGGRFLAMQVINEDHYTKRFVYKPRKYVLTKEDIGTRYALVAIRIRVNAADPADVKAVNVLQNKIQLEQATPGKFVVPNWDNASRDEIRDALLVLANTMENTNGCFGSKDEVDPVKFLMGVAYGWGGSPVKDVLHQRVTPEKNDGKTPYTLTVKDVPVDGFWSISVYNSEGYFQHNQYERYDFYSINSVSGVKNKDGGMTVHFGGDPAQRNFLAIMDGWNYLIRFYRPRQELLDGAWEFPAPQPR